MLFLIISALLIVFSIVVKKWASLRREIGNPRKSVCILVLGDIGRSPRMQYHALSFAREGFIVNLVGYSGSEPLEELCQTPNVSIHYLRKTPDISGLPRFLGYVAKTLWQSCVVLGKLLRDVRSSFVLIQNPPAVPTLPICWLFCRLSGSRLIVDWHNYAYTIMALTLKKDHVLVRLTTLVESLFGARANKHFCVTSAMKDDLRTKWNIEADVLYDRPAAGFKPIGSNEKHSVLTKLSKLYAELRDSDGSSIFTELSETGQGQLKAGRPGLIVSSTSWTEDEDFSILFNALHEYEISCESGDGNLPNLVCAVTGKGPLKEFWKAIIERKTWRHVKIVTPWLENEDYPRLLASADLGVSLHTSSSGLDLPMKVVDMFGCELPVCAYNYKCLDELVRNGENSYTFANETELATRLKDWFSGFPTNENQLRTKEKFQSELRKFRELGWHGNWSSVVIPYFE